MGQSQSGAARAPRTHEELVKELANRFATKCFTPLELYSLKDNFRALADATEDSQHVIKDQSDADADDVEDGETASVPRKKPRIVRYLKEDTVAHFLAIPDILGASPVVFQMITYLGAFPFLNDAPAVLGLEQLVMVITLLTDRYKRVLAHGESDRRTLLFRSLAVYDRRLYAEDHKDAKDAAAADATASLPAENSLGFAVDAPAEEDADGDDLGPGADEDDLVLAAFEALDYVNPTTTIPPSERKGETTGRRKTAAETAATLHGARIPADNFRKLVMLLLVVAPLDPQAPLSLYAADRVTGEALDSLRATAQCVLATFLDVETTPGIKFAHFDAVMTVCFPYLFNGFSALFERFLFSQNLDLSKPKPGVGGGGGGGGGSSSSAGDTSGGPRKRTPSGIAGVSAKEALSAPAPAPPPPPPLLLQESDNTIMNLDLLSQLSFFLPGASLFHRLRLLYSGDNDGFSMGSFETRVFNWRAPTILLVKGTRISDHPRGGQEAAFSAALPPRRFPHGDGSLDGSNSNGDDEPLIFGAYVSQPWQMTHRECFGDSAMVLFQLSPVHDVFGASTLNRDYAAFVKSSAANQYAGGIGFGCPSPANTAVKASLKQKQQQQQQSMEGMLPLGPLSLMIDANLEFGVMTHDRGHGSGGGGGGGGGAFHNSVARTFSFQERFSIEALEVWGCGGPAEAQAQAERWAWEAREAEARRRINLGTGDVEADRALLEMAGLVGANRSGGSMV